MEKFFWELFLTDCQYLDRCCPNYQQIVTKGKINLFLCSNYCHSLKLYLNKNSSDVNATVYPLAVVESKVMPQRKEVGALKKTSFKTNLWATLSTY